MIGVDISELKVSIIIPLYNKEEFIARCLQSVIKQTYDNVECIIINDASTDNSLPIAQEVVNSYNGKISFRILQHENNKGVSAARNMGIKYAKGDYIMFIDADDVITPHAVDLLVDKANELPGVDIVQGNIKKNPLDNDHYELRRFNFPDCFTDNESFRRRFFELWKDINSIVYAKIIRTSFIRENNLLFMEDIIHEDVHWTIKMARVVQTMVFVYDYVYIRYIVPNSIMTTTNSERSGHNWGIILSDVVNDIEERDYLRQYRKFLLWLVLWTKKNPHVKSLREANWLFAKKAFKHHWYLLSALLTVGLYTYGTKCEKFYISMIYWWLNHNK